MAIVEDVSDQKYAERRCMQEEQLREMLSVDVLISGKVNLTKNQVEELWGSSKEDDWKAAEVKRIMQEKGLTEGEPTAVGDEYA